MAAEYEVGKSITPRFRVYTFLIECEETILKAKVFMKGKKMGWVGSASTVPSRPLIHAT
jgi:hypothetical protein